MKIKIYRNQNVLSFDFKTNLIRKGRIHRICNLFKLDEIYMNIYGVYKQSENLIQALLEKEKSLIIEPIDNLYGLSIKVAVKNITKIVEVLALFDYEEINIWDCYTSWEKYLKDSNEKQPFFTVKPINIECDSKFYLNYSPQDGNKVEIICDVKYDNQNILKELNELV